MFYFVVLRCHAQCRRKSYSLIDLRRSDNAMFTNRSHVSPLGNGLFNYSNFTQNNVAAIYPHYYSPLYKTIGSIFVSAIFSIGFLGNLMVVLVVWRAKVMHTPTNCYLVSLAIADILLLISAPLPTLIEFFIVVDQWIFGVVGCSMMVFFQFLGVNVSSLSITAFHGGTIHRHMSPDPIPDHMYSQPCDEDHPGAVELRDSVLRALAGPDHDQNQGLQRRYDDRMLRFQTQKKLLPYLLFD